MDHGYEIAHNLLDADALLVQITYFLPQISDDREESRHYVATTNLLDAVHEYTEKCMLHPDVIGSVQALLPD